LTISYINKICKIDKIDVILNVIFILMRLLPVYTLALLAQICYNLNEKLHFIYTKLSWVFFFSVRLCGLYISVTRVVFIQLLARLALVAVVFDTKRVDCQLIEGLFEFLIWLFPFFIVCYPFYQLHFWPECVASGAFRCWMKTVFVVIGLWLTVAFVPSGLSVKEADY